MKEFDFRKYLKNNPLMEDMRDLAKRPQSLLTKHRPEASDEFWQRVTDDATAQFPDHAEEIESITFGDADKAMKRYEIERDVDGAVSWVLDSLELGEPGGGMYEGDSVIFDKGWEYDDDDFGSDDLDDFNPQDERERFLGLGGQEILDGIKFLIDDGFELEDIMKQIKQHSNYLQSPTMNEGMNDDDSENPFPSLNQNNDDSLFGPNIEKSRPGNLSDYYRNAEQQVKQVALQIDKALQGFGIPEEKLINLTDLIIDLSDAYAEERIDLYNSDNSFN